MISIAITTYNRPEMTLKSFEQVLNDSRVDEIIIVDDHSDLKNYAKLKVLVDWIGKVKVFRNESNKGCYHNKREAVSLAKNQRVILLDSDNIIDTTYISALKDCNDSNVIYAPEFARPHFDYRGFSGQVISKSNVKQFVNQPKFDCLINTCNYLVNRDKYLEVWKEHKEPWTADTLFHNYNHLESGGEIQVVKGLQYQHLVHDGSHYKEHVNKTGNMATDYMNKLRTL